jgi:hypothetical protein
MDSAAAVQRRIDAVQRELSEISALFAESQRELAQCKQELAALKSTSSAAASSLSALTYSGSVPSPVTDMITIDVYNGRGGLDDVFYNELKARLQKHYPGNFELRRYNINKDEYPTATARILLLEYFLASSRGRTDQQVRDDIVRLHQRAPQSAIVPVFITSMDPDRARHRVGDLPNVRMKSDTEHFSLYSSRDVVAPALLDEARWAEIVNALGALRVEKLSTTRYRI